MKHTKAVQARKRVTIKGGLASSARAFPRSRWQRIALIAGCIVLFLIAFAAAAHDAIEKMILERALSSAFGGQATIASLRREGGLTIADGVSVQTVGGSAVLTAERVSYTVSGQRWDVTPENLHLTLDPGKIVGDELNGASGAGRVVNCTRLVLHLANASVTLVRGGGSAARVEIAGVTGTLDAGARPAYDLRANLIGDAGAYPLHASSERWTAPALPVGPLAALLGSDDVQLNDGTAHDLQFTTAGGLHGTLTLAGARGAIAGHRLHDLAGNVTVAPDGIGTTGLDAVLDDGTPVALTGEVHDGVDWSRMVSAGSRDLTAVARMFALIATRPNHRWMNVETVAPGITFGQYAMETKGVPHVVQLLEVDPREPTLHFDTALSHDRIISTGERTSDLALRTHAVAGANGDYFDIGRTYEPQGLLIKSGVMLHGPTDHEAVVFDRANRPTFARFHLRATVTDGTRGYHATLLNSWPTRDVTIITPEFGKTLPAASGITFASLEPLGGTRYRVVALTPMTAPIPVTMGLGFSNLLHEPLPRVGDVLDVQYGLDPPVTGAVAGIGSGPLLLQNGRWYEDKHAPAPDERDVQWPVISIGTMPNGDLMFVAVDGRHPERSIGMTRPEFGQLLQSIGTIDAMALDSGGSVTLVARMPGHPVTSVVNVPSDFSEERYVTDALLVYSSAPLGTIVTTPRPHVEPTPLAPLAP